jgi:hypothetical protein
MLENELDFSGGLFSNPFGTGISPQRTLQVAEQARGFAKRDEEGAEPGRKNCGSQNVVADFVDFGNRLVYVRVTSSSAV